MAKATNRIEALLATLTGLQHAPVVSSAPNPLLAQLLGGFVPGAVSTASPERDEAMREEGRGESREVVATLSGNLSKWQAAAQTLRAKNGTQAKDLEALRGANAGYEGEVRELHSVSASQVATIERLSGEAAAAKDETKTVRLELTEARRTITAFDGERTDFSIQLRGKDESLAAERKTTAALTAGKGAVEVELSRAREELIVKTEENTALARQVAKERSDKEAAAALAREAQEETRDKEKENKALEGVLSATRGEVSVLTSSLGKEREAGNVLRDELREKNDVIETDLSAVTRQVEMLAPLVTQAHRLEGMLRQLLPALGATPAMTDAIISGDLSRVEASASAAPAPAEGTPVKVARAAKKHGVDPSLLVSPDAELGGSATATAAMGDADMDALFAESAEVSAPAKWATQVGASRGGATAGFGRGGRGGSAGVDARGGTSARAGFATPMKK